MKAMVLAAGLGTRLRPLTDDRPKALVEIAGRTLLEITLTRLRTFDVRDVIINVHHFAEMVVAYLKANNNFGMHIEISREDVLLDTGGGLNKAAWFFLEATSQSAEPFILHNVDVISTIDLARMLQFHKDNQALATLAVQTRESSRLLLFNHHLQLCGRHSSGTAIPGCASPSTGLPLGAYKKASIDTPREGTASAGPYNAKTSGALAPEVQRKLPQAISASHPLSSPPPLHALAFSGIHIISPRLLPMIQQEGVFSIIDTYLQLAVQGEKILAFRADEYYWRDLGRPADLTQATHDLHQKLPR